MDADSSNSSKSLSAFGFLTVLESAEHGLFGGYLVLSPQGRPLEFRCSTPIAASRAQAILYGPTLRPYLLTEVIGQALVAGSELSVQLIVTDQRDMMPLAFLRPEDVLYVEPLRRISAESELPTEATALAVDACGLSFELNGCRITAASTSTNDAAAIQARLEPLAANIFLVEPFDRVRAALTEAQLSSHPAAERHDDHAAE